MAATYCFTEDNWPLFESSHQQPIRWQPTLEGDSDNLYAQVITDDRDVLLGKLSTEVHVHGTLRSPTGQPRSTWQVRVQIGPVDKRLIVRGPREFRWQLLGGWRVTDPTPVSEVPLDYRYAFGGHYSLPDGDALANTLYYPDNPAGRGWLPSRADYKRVSSEVARYLKPDLNAVTQLPAPQLEDPDWLVTSPFDRPPPSVRIWVPSMPYLLSLWRSYFGPAQGENSTPNVEEPSVMTLFSTGNTMVFVVNGGKHALKISNKVA